MLGFSEFPGADFLSGMARSFVAQRFFQTPTVFICILIMLATGLILDRVMLRLRHWLIPCPGTTRRPDLRLECGPGWLRSHVMGRPWPRGLAACGQHHCPVCQPAAAERCTTAVTG